MIDVVVVSRNDKAQDICSYELASVGWPAVAGLQCRRAY